jgi:glycosyltransferase involved in cell wall biosynthesis
MTGDAFHPKVDGVSTFNTNVMTELVERNWDVRIVTAIPGPPTIHGISTYRSEFGITLPEHPSHLIGILTPGMCWEILTFRPHVVHVWEGYGILASQVILLCAFLGIRCVVSFHTKADDYAKIQWPFLSETLMSGILWFYEQFVLRLTSCNLVVSLVENKHVPRPTFLSSGVDGKLFTPSRYSQDIRKELIERGGSGGGENEDEREHKLVLHVGRLHLEKRVHEMIPIFNRVQEEMSNVTFVVVGDGGERDSLQTQCDMAGLSVVFCGTLVGEELAAMFASCDVFFSPSDTEAFGLVFMEAMSSGLIPVGARAGAIRTLYEEDVHGYKYSVSKPEEAVQCILKVLQTSNPLMQERGCLLASHHTWMETVNILVNVYEQGQ